MMKRLKTILQKLNILYIRERLVLIIFLIIYFNQGNVLSQNIDFKTLFKSEDTVFKQILNNLSKYRVQLIYTQINRDKDNNPSFLHHFFGDTQQYFYPASTVKFPMILLALNKLNSLPNKEVNTESMFLTEPSLRANIPATYNEPNSAEGYPTLSNYIKQIFLVSSNEAYNRLFEWVGQNEIQQQLTRCGYPNSIIRHRLEVGRDTGQNQWQNAVIFKNKKGQTIYFQPEKKSIANWPKYNCSLGKGYYKNNQLINQAFPFDLKNRIPLFDLHKMLISLIFYTPTQPAAPNFKLTTQDQELLLKYMSMTPDISRYPTYPNLVNYPAYCKFLFYGADTGKLNDNILIFNKVGDAYGFLIDLAYFIDIEKKIEFFLSCVIYCNNDEIFNDDHYDYASYGLPFMKFVGQKIYQYEEKRTRKIKPNFSPIFQLIKK